MTGRAVLVALAALVACAAPPTPRPRHATGHPHAAAVARAIDYAHPEVRTLAGQLASEAPGPVSRRQVFLIWRHIRREWRYVNDPRGQEYYARASETIRNHFVGDCDDFAIVVVAMIESIGARGRVVFTTGHAYPEVFLGGRQGWLNLDWSADDPGGPYHRESWAVAVYSDGSTGPIDLPQPLLPP